MKMKNYSKYLSISLTVLAVGAPSLLATNAPIDITVKKNTLKISVDGSDSVYDLNQDTKQFSIAGGVDLTLNQGLLQFKNTKDCDWKNRPIKITSKDTPVSFWNFTLDKMSLQAPSANLFNSTFKTFDAEVAGNLTTSGYTSINATSNFNVGNLILKDTSLSLGHGTYMTKHFEIAAELARFVPQDNMRLFFNTYQNTGWVDASMRPLVTFDLKSDIDLGCVALQKAKFVLAENVPQWNRLQQSVLTYQSLDGLREGVSLNSQDFTVDFDYQTDQDLLQKNPQLGAMTQGRRQTQLLKRIAEFGLDTDLENFNTFLVASSPEIIEKSLQLFAQLTDQPKAPSASLLKIAEMLKVSNPEAVFKKFRLSSTDPNASSQNNSSSEENAQTSKQSDDFLEHTQSQEELTTWYLFASLKQQHQTPENWKVILSLVRNEKLTIDQKSFLDRFHTINYEAMVYIHAHPFIPKNCDPKLVDLIVNCIKQNRDALSDIRGLIQKYPEIADDIKKLFNQRKPVVKRKTPVKSGSSDVNVKPLETLFEFRQNYQSQWEEALEILETCEDERYSIVEFFALNPKQNLKTLNKILPKNSQAAKNNKALYRNLIPFLLEKLKEKESERVLPTVLQYLGVYTCFNPNSSTVTYIDQMQFLYRLVETFSEQEEAKTIFRWVYAYKGSYGDLVDPLVQAMNSQPSTYKKILEIVKKHKKNLKEDFHGVPNKQLDQFKSELALLQTSQ